MDNITFRVWDDKDQVFLFDFEKLGGISIVGEMVLFGYFDKVKTEKLPHLKLDLSTGIKDRNGKPIYRNDIVSRPLGINGERYNFIVRWYVDGFALQNLRAVSYRSFDWNSNHGSTPKKINYQDWANLEVVGNIYQSKDLLK